MVSCVFPGSFDPVTNGHLDLIRRAARIFDRVTVTVMVNVHKKSAFSTERRVSLLRKACTGLSNVKVEAWDGLLADYMIQKHERIILRGARGSAELEAEFQAAAINRQLNPKVETLFLPTNPGLMGVSSSAVREIAAFGGDISSFVPENVAEEIQQYLSKS